MRKDKKQQKKASGKQLEIFSKTGEPLKGSIDGIDKPLSGGVELLSRLENQRTLTRDLLEKIVDYENLKRAFAQVRTNDGSSGVDGMSIEELRQWLGYLHLSYSTYCKSLIKHIIPYVVQVFPKPLPKFFY